MSEGVLSSQTFEKIQRIGIEIGIIIDNVDQWLVSATKIGERYKFENMYLAGIVPGPKPPSITQLNQYFLPLVDQLDIFFKQGYFLTQTPKYTNGRTARGAMIPVVADLHAAWQVAVLGSSNSTFCCSFCGLLLQDIEEVDPTNWPPIRSSLEHRRCAQIWFNAKSLQEHEAVFDETGVRWTELLRLEYWNPSRFLVFDTMHGWYLNDIENHIRVVFRIDPPKPSGDGLFEDNLNGLTPVPSELARTLVAIRDNHQSSLKLVRRPVYYQLCKHRELRRAGTILQLRRTLKHFYDITMWENISLEGGGRMGAAITKPDRAFRNAHFRLLGATDATRDADARYLEKCHKDILVRLCSELCVPLDAMAVRKAELVKKLLDKVSTQPRMEHYPGLRPGPVLGSDMVEEINADMARTVLPSWISSSPSKFGSSDHGKLSAEEWRTTALVHLAITLPRIWGPRGG
ncbi:hypothetical protein JB92DRAFT_3265622 [Gautieria morchelliformis]|nr:hypothetical protein JB92DRAFT_3265622 [Gautieria morchelliformis]